MLLIVTIVLGALWRFSGISEWPSKYHMTRQYDDALLARHLWLKMRPEALTADEQKWLDGSPASVIEIPILESLAAVGYIVAGGETPWLALLVASCAWLAGGWFVFDLGRRLGGGHDGGLLALMLYLLAPLGIILSRSFQPEALMVLSFVVALWFVVRWRESDSWRGTILTGLLCGVAMLVKPGFALFPLLGAYIASRWPRGGLRAALGPKTWTFAGLMLAPSLVYGWFFLAGHGGQKILPHLLLGTAYYQNWWSQMDAAVGWYLLAAAIVGACLMQRNGSDYVGYGLLAGYVAFSATFTWHTMTHSYYHAILVPIAAICAAPLGTAVGRLLRAQSLRPWQAGLCLAVLVATMIRFAAPASAMLQSADYAQAITFYEQLGKIGGTGSQVAYLGPYYGRPLAFHGWACVYAWPVQGDLLSGEARGVQPQPVAERFEKMLRGYRPTHFIVNDLNEIKAQPELAALLAKYPKVAEGPAVVVHDLREDSSAPGKR